MRTLIGVCSLTLLALATVSGCGGSRETIVRRETVQTVPAAPVVVEKRTTVVPAPVPPTIVEERTIRTERTTTEIEE